MSIDKRGPSHGSRDRKGAPMARSGPLKTMKVATSSPTRTIPITPATLQSRDRKEADLPQPIPLTFNGADLPQPIPLTLNGPGRHRPPNRSGLQ